MLREFGNDLLTLMGSPYRIFFDAKHNFCLGKPVDTEVNSNPQPNNDPPPSPSPSPTQSGSGNNNEVPPEQGTGPRRKGQRGSRTLRQVQNEMPPPKSAKRTKKAMGQFTEFFHSDEDADDADQGGNRKQKVQKQVTKRKTPNRRGDSQSNAGQNSNTGTNNEGMHTDNNADGMNTDNNAEGANNAENTAEGANNAENTAEGANNAENTAEGANNAEDPNNNNLMNNNEGQKKDNQKVHKKTGTKRKAPNRRGDSQSNAGQNSNTGPNNEGMSSDNNAEGMNTDNNAEGPNNDSSINNNQEDGNNNNENQNDKGDEKELIKNIQHYYNVQVLQAACALVFFKYLPTKSKCVSSLNIIEEATQLISSIFGEDMAFHAVITPELQNDALSFVRLTLYPVEINDSIEEGIFVDPYAVSTEFGMRVDDFRVPNWIKDIERFRT